MKDWKERSLIYRVSILFFAIFFVTSGISITVSQVSLLIAFFLWIYGLIKNDENIEYYKTGIERYIILFVLVSVILAFFSHSIIGNLLYLKDFWLISAFVLASSLLQTRSDILKFVYLIIVIALLQSIAGFVGYYTNINFENALKYGIDHPQARISLMYIVGFLGHHLTYGAYLMMLLIPLFYLCFLRKSDSFGIPKTLLIFSSIVTFVALIVSWSRSVIIALPFASLPLFFKKKKLFMIVLTLFILVVVFIFSGLGPSKNIINNLYNESSRIRIQIWTNACKVWIKHPFFGSGGANYDEEFKNQVKENLEANRPFCNNFPDMKTHAHNDYLNQLARKGIFGFLAFIYMLYGIVKYMVNNINSIEEKFFRYLYLGLFGSITAFLAASMFQCYFTDEENLVMFWFAIGLLAAIVKIETKENLNKV